MRVYFGLTRSELAAFYETRSLGPAPLPAYAVTPALREHYAEGDREELEYAATAAAAEACLAKLAAAPDEPRRRFVVAAELPDTAVRPDPTAASPASAIVTADVPWIAVDAVLADDPAAEPTIVAAAAAWDAAQAGDDDASFTVDEADGWELMWFATQETPDLLA